MITKLRYSFEELSLSLHEIEEYMGFEKGLSPDPFPELIKAGLLKASFLCNISGGIKVLSPAFVDKTNNQIRMGNTTFSPGKIVTARLFHANSAALFVCTAGNQISEHSKKISTEGDALTGYIFDTIGSLIVEKAVDKMQEWLKNKMAIHGLNISDRFSPGYCNWDVSEQQKLFSLLPPRFCGITLSSSSLMNPIKSVSGIIGIGPELKQKGYQCNWCDDLNCFYGKIKRQKKPLKKSE
ncbi:methionine synthase [Maribellus comscasis]|uniref:Methionine synthase n=1 Tax=Maribellus comscasis TaxID=2681766 RepID=A0A6I6JT92_9BACT|nr:vitamin B12 dependent-methionine synthase activation domain-containing protein [Maribellus comscasis]QGY43367.1 methionine synthase [Maribellus comscasis]